MYKILEKATCVTYDRSAEIQLNKDIIDINEKVTVIGWSLMVAINGCAEAYLSSYPEETWNDIPEPIKKKLINIPELKNFWHLSKISG